MRTSQHLFSAARKEDTRRINSSLDDPTVYVMGCTLVEVGLGVVSFALWFLYYLGSFWTILGAVIGVAIPNYMRIYRENTPPGYAQQFFWHLGIPALQKGTSVNPNFFSKKRLTLIVR